VEEEVDVVLREVAFSLPLARRRRRICHLRQVGAWWGQLLFYPFVVLSILFSNYLFFDGLVVI
jgi:hypothetical protein